MDYVLKTKAIDKLDSQLETVDPESLRHHILEKAKDFKTTWIEFGQALYPVWRDKAYRDWGFLTFEGYVVKEVGIRKETAMKLLRSYSFLEKEEPKYISRDHYQELKPGNVPCYESVDILRRVKNKGLLKEEDYGRLRENVLDKAQEPKQIKQELTTLIRQREELTPQEAQSKERLKQVNRMISALKVAKRDIELLQILPVGLVKDIDVLISRIEKEIEKK